MNTGKIDKEKDFLGEVWLPDSGYEKHPCLLSFQDNQIILTTNLRIFILDDYLKQNSFSDNKILGKFDSFGNVTFFDCSPINSIKYISKYLFYNIPGFIDDYKLIKAKKVSVCNDIIGKHTYFSVLNNRNEVKINTKEQTDCYEINGIKLKIKIVPNDADYTKRTKYVILNKSYIDFKFEDAKTINEIIEIYNKFQKILFFLLGEFSLFEKFEIYLLGTGIPVSVFFKNRKKSRTSPFQLIKMDYQKIKPVLEELLKTIYAENEFLHCFNQLMENYLSEDSTDHQKFHTSVISYKAFLNNYLKNTDDSKDNKPFSDSNMEFKRSVFEKIIEYKNEICQKCREEKCIKCKEVKIIECNEKKCKNGNWNNFVKKIVNTRNNYVHGNYIDDKEKDSKIFFRGIELRILSFLIDFVVAYSLLEYALKDSKNKNEFLNRYEQDTKHRFQEIPEFKEFKV